MYWFWKLSVPLTCPDPWHLFFVGGIESELKQTSNLCRLSHQWDFLGQTNKTFFIIDGISCLILGDNLVRTFRCTIIIKFNSTLYNFFNKNVYLIWHPCYTVQQECEKLEANWPELDQLKKACEDMEAENSQLMVSN